MTKITDRLRTSRQIALQNDYLAGMQEGRSWASKTAGYEQLVQISRFCSAVENCRRADKPSRQAIDPWDRQAFATVKAACDDTDHITAFFGGFMEGANEIFQKVKDQIQG